jgi:DNA polymerase III sliding clamp (beta) subunit (PCNA family)
MFELDSSIQIPRLPFYDAIYSVMDVLDVEDNNRLSITIRDNTLFLKNDKVESEQEFDESFGSELDVDVNGALLESLLKDFVSDSLQIDFTPGNNYIVFSDPDNANHTSLLTTVKRR